jgi:F1F0 ATPase subunit 2
MNNFAQLLWPLLAGLGIGAFYFGGLWLTVRTITRVEHPAPLFLLSFIGRSVLSLLGFYLVMDGAWSRAVACLLGFIIMRTVTTRVWGPQTPPMATGGPHAPGWQGGAQ